VASRNGFRDSRPEPAALLSLIDLYSLPRLSRIHISNISVVGLVQRVTTREVTGFLVIGSLHGLLDGLLWAVQQAGVARFVAIIVIGEFNGFALDLSKRLVLSP
jgi:hypothetical protein